MVASKEMHRLYVSQFHGMKCLKILFTNVTIDISNLELIEILVVSPSIYIGILYKFSTSRMFYVLLIFFFLIAGKCLCMFCIDS